MWHNVAILTSLLISLVAYDVWRIPVPPDSKDPIPARRFMYGRRLAEIKSVIYGHIWGLETKYSTWIESMRSPYKPKTDRLEEGLKIRDAAFGKVPVRVYEPLTKEDNGPGMIWIHGGGWIVGSVDGTDGKCRELAINLNAVTVCIAYRLAPEHPYPAPFLDCLEATTHFLHHAAEFGVNSTRIALGGGSVGGTLAAAVALKLRDIVFTPPLKLQVLMYPATQSIDFDLPSYILHENDPVLPRERMIAMWLFYANGDISGIEAACENNHVPHKIKSELQPILNHSLVPGGKTNTLRPSADSEPVEWERFKHVMLDPYFAPLLAKDLSDLPQALVYTVDQDVLRDDGILYAHRLKEAGNKVKHYHNLAGFHGLNSFGLRVLNSTDAQKSENFMNSYIRNNL